MTPPKRSFNILNVNLWGHGGLGVKTFASYLQGTYILIYLKIFKAYFLNVFFFSSHFLSVFQFLFHFFPPLSLSRCPYDYTDLFVLMSSSDSTRIDRMLWGEVRWGETSHLRMLYNAKICAIVMNSPTIQSRRVRPPVVTGLCCTRKETRTFHVKWSDLLEIKIIKMFI